MLCLNVDDFGIKYVGGQHAQHVLDTLQEQYTVTTDWEGNKYSGIDLEWDYKSRTCRLTMENYIRQILIRYGHPEPRKLKQLTHQYIEIIYGASIKTPLEVLGKHWRATSVGAHFQCSPGADPNLLVDSPLMEFHLAVCQSSSN